MSRRVSILEWARDLFRKPSAPQPEGLLSVLVDPNAPDGDRDDAAMDLSGYDDPAVEAALRRIASDPTTHEDLADTCGDSLGEIWKRQGRNDAALLEGLTPAARATASTWIKQ